MPLDHHLQLKQCLITMQVSRRTPRTFPLSPPPPLLRSPRSYLPRKRLLLSANTGQPVVSTGPVRVKARRGQSLGVARPAGRGGVAASCCEGASSELCIRNQPEPTVGRASRAGSRGQIGSDTSLQSANHPARCQSFPAGSGSSGDFRSQVRRSGGPLGVLESDGVAGGVGGRG